MTMLQEVEEALEIVHEHAAMPKVIQVAAHAALMLAQKYHLLNDECEVYQIAIGASILSLFQPYVMALKNFPTAMCPDKKLQWLINHDWNLDAVKEVCQLVLHRWVELYKLEAVATAPPVTLKCASLIMSLC
jgi:hypothetical protein